MHTNAKIRYRASNMILNVHSDASYLSAPKAQNGAGDYFFLGSILGDSEWIFINGKIHITCTILNLVAALATEVELGALFLNAQEAKVILYLRNSDTRNRLHSYTKDNGQKKWKCSFSGYLMAKSKNYSISTTNLIKRN
jgi:hypothetical protein